jgi:AbrB family looped-hinge helix DNA binding protein
MWHNSAMAHRRFTVHVGERGRVVLPAEVRQRLHIDRGDLLALDFDEGEGTLLMRTADDVAQAARGMLSDLAPGADLAAELIEDRREEAERDNAEDSLAQR